ncbi:MAG: hypothetical protein JSW71_13490 [Gemmatimonadota bacterium]|nr:MAG: hypothetical protein JSW71_13490 [Gemmatimonadota bacterium]
MIHAPRTSDRRHLTITALATIALSGCPGREAQIEVHVLLHEGEPLIGVEVSAFPFDPDRLLDSLAQESHLPRPRFPELEDEMAAYRRPDERSLRDVGTVWLVQRDSVAHLADSLNAVSPDSPGYAAAYERLRRQYQRLTQSAVERDRAFRERIGDDRDLASRAAAAADSLRRWERQAFADFPDLADSALEQSGKQVHHSVTDASGIAQFTLTTGSWWVVARWPDPENPFMERYWNAPLFLSALGPAIVPLFAGNSEFRWRH